MNSVTAVEHAYSTVNLYNDFETKQYCKNLVFGNFGTAMM